MKRKNPVFIVELFLMFVMMIMVITVITVVSVRSRSESIRASQLTQGVICAQNAAEATAEAGDTEDAEAILGKMENVSDITVSGDTIEAKMTMTGGDGEEETFLVRITSAFEPGESGVYVDKDIVVMNEDGEQVYTLETGNYVKNGEGAL